MVPESLHDFLVASAGAGGALIGLLFVAVSVAPERILARDAPVERGAIVASAFTALVNAFFVSLGGLIPGTNLGGLALAMSLLALANTAFLGRRLLQARFRGRRLVQAAVLLLASVAVYGAQLRSGLALLGAPQDTGALYAITWLVVATYGIGLGRAWQLLGARREGLTGWLSLLNEAEERAAGRAPTPPRDEGARGATAPGAQEGGGRAGDPEA